MEENKAKEILKRLKDNNIILVSGDKIGDLELGSVEVNDEFVIDELMDLKWKNTFSRMLIIQKLMNWLIDI